MNYLIKVYKTVFPFVVTTLAAYLVGAFLSASFAPADWEVQLRIVMAGFGLGLGFALWFRLTWEGLA